MTYLVGWLSETGRRLRANHGLFWHALLRFKSHGYRYFDVGGMCTDESHAPDGITRFKQELGGDEYSLVGEYSRFSIPLLPRKP